MTHCVKKRRGLFSHFENPRENASLECHNFGQHFELPGVPKDLRCKDRAGGPVPVMDGRKPITEVV